MKPRNFPGRKLRRQINMRLRIENGGKADYPAEREIALLLQPTDIRIRMGAAKRKAQLP